MRNRLLHLSVLLLVVCVSVLGLSAVFAQAAGGAVAAVPGNVAAGDYVLAHPVFPKISGLAAVLDLQNVGDAAATGEMRAYDAAGNPGGMQGFALPAFGQGGASTADGFVPAGESSVLVGSELPLASVVRVYDPLNRLGMYYGLAAALPNGGPDGARPLGVEAGLSLVFAPVLQSSSLVVQNLGEAPADIRVVAYDDDGVDYLLADEENVAVDGVLSVRVADSEVPRGFLGMAVVTADQPLDGVLNTAFSSAIGDAFESYNALVPGERVTLPRALKGIDEGMGLRNTMLFIGNPGDVAADVEVSLLRGNGSVGATFPISPLPAKSSTIVPLSLDDDVPEGTVWAVVATADAPVVLGESTYFERLPEYGGSGSYGATPLGAGPYAVHLPRLVRDEFDYSAFSIQNTGVMTAAVTVRFYDGAGDVALTDNFNLAPGGWKRVILADVEAFAGGFVGSATATSSVPIAAWVDEYHGFVPPCEAVTTVAIERVPGGTVQVGQGVRFTAVSDGTSPLAYQWMLNGYLIGANTPNFKHAFITEGAHEVGVRVSNRCSSQAEAIDLQVAPATADVPNLGGSRKTASLSDVGKGDSLAYTLTLINSSDVAAQATLSDPIPDDVAYMPGSAAASDGGPVSVQDDLLMWSGEVISGTPVIVTFAGIVQEVPLGTVIRNEATVDDGAGGRTTLVALSNYNPGYRLSINDGATYTNDPVVDLSFTFVAADNPTEYQLSNDAGFSPLGGTTSWLALDAADPTHDDWELPDSAVDSAPRRVYIRYRDAQGTVIGPFSDQIIYDGIRPVVNGVVVVPVSSLRRAEAQEVVVQVSAGDSNSGILAVQLSDSASFSSHSSDPPGGGKVTEIPWQLAPSGVVYARVIDRAGNFSRVKSGSIFGAGPVLFLPAVVAP